ncbi:hypothetical protein PoB_003792100 [Plakobranchus ocellatus]|uniref:Uncharacterized protein n=1 Tax=Plakobranchus ocellatus TaxID=259542 RepID=A0AAV4AY21_9GAST|nr:hypothetical protein PoB_003792100 [Plakobranchus ocellatus]
MVTKGSDRAIDSPIAMPLSLVKPKAWKLGLGNAVDLQTAAEEEAIGGVGSKQASHNFTGLVIFVRAFISLVLDLPQVNPVDGLISKRTYDRLGLISSAMVAPLSGVSAERKGLRNRPLCLMHWI